MRTTIQQLHGILAIAIEQGYGDVAIACRQSNYGATIVLEPAEPKDAAALAMFTVSDCKTIGPAIVNRFPDGRWKHPAFPEELEPGMLKHWLADKGLTFTINFLIPPAGSRSNDVTEDELPECQVRAPAGDKWFLWQIDMNSYGTPIAVWVAPTK